MLVDVRLSSVRLLLGAVGRFVDFADVQDLLLAAAVAIDRYALQPFLIREHVNVLYVLARCSVREVNRL